MLATLNLHVSTPRSNFKNMIKTKILTRNYTLSNSVIIFFPSSKSGRKEQNFIAQGPRQKFKNPVHRILGKEFL